MAGAPASDHSVPGTCKSSFQEMSHARHHRQPCILNMKTYNQPNRRLSKGTSAPAKSMQPRVFFDKVLQNGKLTEEANQRQTEHVKGHYLRTRLDDKPDKTTH